ncbi:MAG: hypothetical protein ChlgKO_06980 [Chlamydiales bacterium]
MSNKEENDSELDDLKVEYLKTVPEKLQEIEKLIADFLANPNKETKEALKLPVHKTAGSAGSYGFQKVTEMCRVMDQELASLTDFANIDSWNEKLTEFFSKLKDEFGKPPSS